MTNLKRVSNLLIVVLILCTSILPAFSLTRYNIFVEEYSFDYASEIWENINLQSSDMLTSNAPHIYNMDVSESGKVAVTLTSVAQDSVAVFDENGVFLKSFTYDSYGSVYVGWNDENLVLFCVRGDVAFEFSLDGELVTAYSYYDTEIYDALEQNSIEMNGNLYQVKSDSILTKTDSAGNEIIMYKSIVTLPSWVFPVIVFLVLFVAFIIIVVCTIIKVVRNLSQQK